MKLAHDENLQTIARVSAENACLRELLNISSRNEPGVCNLFCTWASSQHNLINGLIRENRGIEESEEGLKIS